MKRCNISCHDGSVYESPNGIWVKHSDALAAIEAARREEREACAKLADQIAKVAERHFAAMGSAGMGADPGTARDIATAIRARKP